MASSYQSECGLNTPLQPAGAAFDAIASKFDSRFGEWLSVAAQRRAVRSLLLREFPVGGSLLEVGGGTGEDAAFLAAHGYRVHLTDASPTMVAIARKKLVGSGCHTDVIAAEELADFAAGHFARGGTAFDGVYSNFAALNCVTDLRPVARGLAQFLKPGACAMLVLFGVSCPGEMLVEALRGRPHHIFRRFKATPVTARLANLEFNVAYHRGAALRKAFSPWFELEERFGIGITVPPSAAEPWISRHGTLLSWMERMDKPLSKPLASLGDHILYQFRRNAND